MGFSYYDARSFGPAATTGIYKLSMLDKITYYKNFDFIRNFGIFNPKAALLLQNALKRYPFKSKIFNQKIFINTTGEVCLITFNIPSGIKIEKKLYGSIETKESDATVDLREAMALKLKLFWKKYSVGKDEKSDHWFCVYTDDLNGFKFEGAEVSNESIKSSLEEQLTKYFNTNQYGFSKRPTTYVPFTYNEYRIIYETLMNRPIDKIKAKYGEEAVTKILGKGVSPFTMTLVNTLAGEMSNLLRERGQEMENIEQEYLKLVDKLESDKVEQKAKCYEKYDNKIEEIHQKIETVLHMTTE